MTKKTRTILFLVFLILFLAITPTVVLYSQGYRINFNPSDNGKIITQTGGLYLKTEPKQSEIYLDGKLAKKTDFLFGSVLIDNLLPKEYKIEVKKTRFISWEKTLEIKEKEVQEVRNIVLFPKDQNFNVLLERVEKVWLSPDQKKMVLEEINENGWALKLYDLAKNIKSKLIDEIDISPKGADLMNLTFSENSKEAFLEAGVTEKLKYFTLNIEKIPPVAIENKFAVSTTSENIIVSKKINNDIYYLDNSGYLFRNAEKLNPIPFQIKYETEYALETFQNSIFLKEDKNLYQFNPGSKTFEEISGETNGFKISPDGKKLVYFSDYEIWILYLKDAFEGQQKKAGDKVFLMRVSEKIGDCQWLNNNYMVFNSGNNIKIIETDDRDRINIVDLGELKNPTLYWSNYDGKLYILSGGNLYSSDILIP